ncbi:ABC transporter permease [Lachnoclostridium sp. Marseille-P6806]|uniref:ABC transporter permease n=1 Tax=Lachnoclostridium sp. Marseille-P6806 TaxID=2364793 RepID=UPI001F5FD47C|nr:ABC transporter permease [Lachnoclostridium sp. Marseille-P6806]
MFLTAGIIQTALETGLIYGLVALSLFISFTILNVCDLSTDGCYTLGCAVGALVTLSGHPVLAVFASIAAGVLSGFITGILQTTFRVQSILAGIIVNTGLYTVNLAVMGFKSNIAIFGTPTVFSLWKGLSDGAFWQEWSALILLLLLAALLVLVLHFFLGTRLGLSIRATGDSSPMVRASSINPGFMIVVGLCISGGLTGLAGSLIGQYNKMSDINLGTGMVTIALASLIIGQTFSNRSIHMLWKLVSVLIGSMLYRFIISLALRLNVPTEAFKLVSALIVAVAIAAPQLRALLSIQRKRSAELRARAQRKGK